MKRPWVKLLISFLLIFYGSVGFTSTIDWSGFDTIDSSDPVGLLNDTTIVFTEVELLGEVFFFNDNYFVENAWILSFDYEILLPGLKSDYLSFKLYDDSGNQEEYVEFPESPPSTDTVSGHYSIDLSPYQNQIIGLEWGFIEGSIDGDAASSATIYNINLTPIPEPNTLMLFGFGLLVLTGYRKRNV